MKKLLAIAVLFFLPSLARASYQSVQGSTVSAILVVNGSTVTPTNPVPTMLGPNVVQKSYHVCASSATYSSTTDLMGLRGNATTTVYVKRVTATCTQTTAGIITASLIKRSSFDTGAFSTMTIVSNDSNYAAAASSMTVYSAAPTKGTLVGMLYPITFGCLASATAADNGIYMTPSNVFYEPIVLRNNQELDFSLAAPTDGSGVTLSGGTVQVCYDFTETP